MSIIMLVEEPQVHNHSKHIKLRYHSIKDEANKGEITVSYIHSTELMVDPLMKPYPRESFE